MKSVSSSWSFLRDSSELHAAIKYRMDELDLSIVALAHTAEVTPDRLSRYLRGIRPSLTNYQIVKLANSIGIEVFLDIKFT